MTSKNPLNTYKGPNSLVNYYDPSCQPPLPLVEIPASLNPFAAEGVHVYAKMMTFLPVHNVKALPALNMLSKKSRDDPSLETIVEYSSGSTIISMSVIARILYGIEDTRAFLSNKTSEAKLRLMRFFGLRISLFGGPSQPEPSDPRGGIQKAKEMAEANPRVFNPNQYENDLVSKLHPSRASGLSQHSHRVFRTAMPMNDGLALRYLISCLRSTSSVLEWEQLVRRKSYSLGFGLEC